MTPYQEEEFAQTFDGAKPYEVIQFLLAEAKTMPDSVRQKCTDHISRVYGAAAANGHPLAQAMCVAGALLEAANTDLLQPKE